MAALRRGEERRQSAAAGACGQGEGLIEQLQVCRMLQHKSIQANATENRNFDCCCAMSMHNIIVAALHNSCPPPLCRHYVCPWFIETTPVCTKVGCSCQHMPSFSHGWLCVPVPRTAWHMMGVDCCHCCMVPPESAACAAMHMCLQNRCVLQSCAQHSSTYLTANSAGGVGPSTAG